MKSILLAIALFVGVAVSTPAFAAEAVAWRVSDISNVQLSDRTRFVTNPDGVLSTDAVAALDSICYSLKERGIAEVAIVAVRDIYPRDMLGFSQELFEGWGVGDDELDNGLGILLVEGMREIRFHTGYGIEGVLTDAHCYEIQQQYMVPYFRQGDYSAGMVAGVRAVDELLTSGELPRAEAEAEDDGVVMWLALCIVVIFVLVPIVMVVVAERAKTKCPNCGKHSLRVVKRDRMILSTMQHYIVETLHCDNCHTDHTRRQRDDDHRSGNGGGGIWFFPLGMGGTRGGGYGGGFGGGGFGGGSFGGGGSGSSW